MNVNEKIDLVIDAILEGQKGQLSPHTLKTLFEAKTFKGLDEVKEANADLKKKYGGIRGLLP